MEGSSADEISSCSIALNSRYVENAVGHHSMLPFLHGFKNPVAIAGTGARSVCCDNSLITSHFNWGLLSGQNRPPCNNTVWKHIQNIFMYVSIKRTLAAICKTSLENIAIYSIYFIIRRIDFPLLLYLESI